jgi:hypothetical protein
MRTHTHASSRFLRVASSDDEHGNPIPIFSSETPVAYANRLTPKVEERTSGIL